MSDNKFDDDLYDTEVRPEDLELDEEGKRMRDSLTPEQLQYMHSEEGLLFDTNRMIAIIPFFEREVQKWERLFKMARTHESKQEAAAILKSAKINLAAAQRLRNTSLDLLDIKDVYLKD